MAVDKFGSKNQEKLLLCFSVFDKKYRIFLKKYLIGLTNSLLEVINNNIPPVFESFSEHILFHLGVTTSRVLVEILT